MNANPDEVVADFGNRVVELERLALQSNQREQELRGRIDDMVRAVLRNQGGGANRDRSISEFKVVLHLRVLTDDRSGHKEWRTKFVNLISQVRPGMR